ncbi:recombination protein RecR [Spiribacter sp. C176]|uniref:Recombination protein RecR n=1 Tax=Spiribacter salilacus TaxID=2664894 RepID=A0A6N7QYK1_9GAMM|nr:recombination mediator RecR [Spiribacter salilacus]MRH77754.1 recombination protein RecR [Spiribacter salilacus]
MSGSRRVQQLMEAFRCLPGVGPKSAQRMTYTLLQRDREGASRLADALLTAIAEVGECQQCRSLSETAICALCDSERRDRSVLCVVENPSDVQMIEEATDFQGLYFVLQGRLSPLDGIGPAELGLDRLEARFVAGEVQEVILAINPTVEGEATAHYVASMAREAQLSVSRIAHGVPLGGDLEFVDSGTLSHAFAGRMPLV